ncbi:hypothetical protein L210DRAFT_981818 [Boletus edulis BED1]|uniref:Uncharacterized protein n=1 Tax=Boletus edulis BED1 TaxID=1328754 RepID=A0AAD4BTW2_BOLED|nr:hypothetical protein L210DRAFT_981818 [Boletus edulis BED1]
MNVIAGSNVSNDTGSTKIYAFIKRSRYTSTKCENFNLQIFVMERKKAIMLPKLLSNSILERTTVMNTNYSVDAARTQPWDSYGSGAAAGEEGGEGEDAMGGDASPNENGQGKAGKGEGEGNSRGDGNKEDRPNENGQGKGEGEGNGSGDGDEEDPHKPGDADHWHEEQEEPPQRRLRKWKRSKRQQGRHLRDHMHQKGNPQVPGTRPPALILPQAERRGYSA